MSNRKRFQAVPQPLRSLNKAIKAILNWLSRGLLNLGKPQRRRQATAGFILPTVAMVMLVVVLITTAMVLRSFDRGKNASNFRVNEATLNAATPALDRARSKIEELFSDPTLPRSTPTDDALLRVLNTNLQRYTFGDEIQLKLVFDFPVPDPNNPSVFIRPLDGTIEDRALRPAIPVENDETLRSAWKFPVDTDNNGKFDTFTLYAMYFRNPSRGANGSFNRSRNPLEARTPPMDEGRLGGQCNSAVTTSANLVGDSGWYRTGDRLKKSILVYAINAPITALSDLDPNQYEVSQGARGFSALEYQQDRSRIPLANNAVVYEDDLEIAPGAGLLLNGRVKTNSNLLIGQQDQNNIVGLRLVSSPFSCYYTEEASKVFVGGNIAGAQVNQAADVRNARIDLFRGSRNTPRLNQDIGAATKTVTNNGGSPVAYNNEAYNQRINFLVDAALARGAQTVDDNREITASPDPQEVRDSIQKRILADRTLNADEVRREEWTVYFRGRTRRVPFAEVADGADPLVGAALQENPVRPPNAWMYPVNPDNNTQSNTGTLALNFSPAARPSTTDPNQKNGLEWHVGDRVLVSNNLPEYIYEGNQFVQNGRQNLMPENGIERRWHNSGNGMSDGTIRYRESTVSQLADLGVADRDRFWEVEGAATAPINPTDSVGGLRVITGAGIYLPFNNDVASTTPPPVWSDSMPMPSPEWMAALQRNDIFDEFGRQINSNDSTRPYLKMRATAVYHYKDPGGGPNRIYDPDQNPIVYPEPIACVSSYYNPTSSETAQNLSGLWQDTNLPTTTQGRSNNGIVYNWRHGNNSIGALGNSYAGRSYRDILNYQARLRYPSGRFVHGEPNPTLAQPTRRALIAGALAKLNSANQLIDPNQPLTLSERTAIDTAVCALDILSGQATPQNYSYIQNGDIYERAFLDAREVRAIEGSNGTANDYDLSIEERQPLEVRATVINLGNIRQRQIGGSTPTQEYLLPNSGIIYASRDDALPDLSDAEGTVGTNPPYGLSATPTATEVNNFLRRKSLSATDYRLDPSRRPNAIMLVNGSRLDRVYNDRTEEKGLILATPLPVYIQGDFNLHEDNSGTAQREFSDGPTTDFYARQNLNPNFACRPNGPVAGCTNGDRWRPATVLADAVTLLSDNFRLGFRNEGDYDLRNNLGSAASGYDLDGNGFISTPTAATNPSPVVSEVTYGFDLNGDGDATDTDVQETQVSSVAARRLNGFFENNFVTSRPFNDALLSRTAALTDAERTSDPGLKSSYFSNFVTPVQRRARTLEYVMEICRKATVSSCGPNDWVVGINLSGAENFRVGQIPVGTPVAQLTAGTTASPAIDIALTPLNDQLYPRRVAFLRDPADNRLILDPRDNPIPLGIDSAGKVQYYPYANGSSGVLIPMSSTLPTELSSLTDLATECGTTPCVFDPSTGTPRTFARFLADNANARPRQVPDTNLALWFVGSRQDAQGSFNPVTNPKNWGWTFPLFVQETVAPDTTFAAPTGNTYRKARLVGQHPRLVPVLQLQVTTRTSPDTGESNVNNIVRNNDNQRANATNWMQKASDAGTTFNLVMAAGDTPARPVEDNGGLGNYPRFLESWDVGLTSGSANPRETRINGSFIQMRRSAYATAPFKTSLATDTNPGGIFGYPQAYRTPDNGSVGSGNTQGGLLPYYFPPRRTWGFDVALLTQQPDLFAQRFTVPPSAPPNEFFRQVSRDDAWVRVLMCAAQPTSTLPGGGTPIRGGYDPGSQDDLGLFNEPNRAYRFALSGDQRPQSCSTAAQGGALRG
ncbi:MAG: hormogonium polysaccharide biosynthesis protein HpsA [Desertifilum sp.]|nr:hormogonium polysaccharide biosynthesis protein HpsA [Desertifilum sp.]